MSRKPDFSHRIVSGQSIMHFFSSLLCRENRFRAVKLLTVMNITIAIRCINERVLMMSRHKMTSLKNNFLLSASQYPRCYDTYAPDFLRRIAETQCRHRRHSESVSALSTGYTVHFFPPSPSPPFLFPKNTVLHTLIHTQKEGFFLKNHLTSHFYHVKLLRPAKNHFTAPTISCGRQKQVNVMNKTFRHQYEK